MDSREQTFKLFDSRISNGRTALKNHAKKMGYQYYSEYIYESYKFKTNRQIRDEIEAAGCKFVPKLQTINNMNARIVKALQEGADGVLVSGCHPGDCHYISGNLVARRKFALLKNFLEYLGIKPERVQFSWVSASEGNRFAELIKKIVMDVKKLNSENRLVKRL